MRKPFEKRKRQSQRPIPFAFVLELLHKVNPFTRPMFGCTSIYVGPKIVLILREKDQYPKDNGIWIATTEEHHSSLKQDFPSLRSIGLFGGGTTGWQNLPVDEPDFESAASLLCDFVLKGDPRIGKVPKPRFKSKSKKKRRSKAGSRK